MVGTRSTASLISLRKFGTRWNASLPSFSLAYCDCGPMVADEKDHGWRGVEKDAVEGIGQQFAHAKRGNKINGQQESQGYCQQEPERLNMNKAKPFPRDCRGQDQQQPNAAPIIEFHKLYRKSAQHEA